MQRSHISINIETDTFIALVHFLDLHYPGRDPGEVVHEAIRDWILHWSWDGDPNFMQNLRNAPQ